MAIQALVLTENPLENEPGYDEQRDLNKPKYEAYNESVRFANYKISILEMMKRPPPIFEVFQPVMEEHKMQKKEKWIEKMREYHEKNKVIDKDGNQMNRIIDMPCYRHRMKINYEELIQILQE